MAHQDQNRSSGTGWRRWEQTVARASTQILRAARPRLGQKLVAFRDARWPRPLTVTLPRPTLSGKPSLPNDSPEGGLL